MFPLTQDCRLGLSSLALRGWNGDGLIPLFPIRIEFGNSF